MQKPNIGKIPFSGTIYQWVVGFSSFILPVVGFFSPKVNNFLSGRVDWRSRLRQSMKSLHAHSGHKSPVLLFHCASVGEFEQARPVIEKLHSELPGHRIVLSFFSPSGYDLRKNYSSADLVTYLPLDSKSNVRDFLDLICPNLVVSIKYEFWPNFLLECHHRNIPVVSVSAIFRENHFYFQPWGSFFLYALRTIQHFFVQDSNSQHILRAAGIHNVTVAGDTRFDRVISIKEKSLVVPEAVAFVGNDPAFVIGSAWPEDMKILEPVIRKYSTRMKFIVVPHEVDPSSLHSIGSYLPPHVRLSSWSVANTESVLVVDKMGLLSRLYASANVAWVGGAYGKGLHNILEAAVYGLPVFFGDKNFEKFREARELIRVGSAFAIGNFEVLEAHLEKILTNADYTKSLNDASKNYVQNNKGATDTIIQYLTKVLN